MDDPDIFEAELTDQVALLADACRSFDAGKVYQIKAISTRVYVICHDLIRTKAWHTWSRGKIELASTATASDPRNLLKSHHPLAAHSFGKDGPSFAALGSNPPPHKFNLLRFSRWWDEPVITVEESKVLTRRDLILQMRNYDGGSHGLEKDPSDDYRSIRDDRGVGWVAVEDGNPTDFKLSALEATTRQLAHELLYSLIPQLLPNNRRKIDYDVMWSPMPGGACAWPRPSERE